MASSIEPDADAEHPDGGSRVEWPAVAAVAGASLLVFAVLIGVDVARGGDAPEASSVAIGIVLMLAAMGLGVAIGSFGRGRWSRPFDAALVLIGGASAVYGVVGLLGNGAGGWMALVIGSLIAFGAASRLLR